MFSIFIERLFARDELIASLKVNALAERLNRKKKINSKINWLKYVNHTNKSPEAKENALKLLLLKKERIESEIKQSIIEEQRRKEESVLEKIKTNPKVFYAYAKQQSKVKCRIGPLKGKDGKLTSDPKDMADLLQEQYKVFSDPEKQTDFYPEANRELPGIETIDICEEDFVTAIDLVPSNSASGPDKFPISILKECKKELAKPLCIIWRRSLETSEIPGNIYNKQ